MEPSISSTVIPILFSELFSMPSLQSLCVHEMYRPSAADHYLHISHIEWKRDIGGSITLNELACRPPNWRHSSPLDRRQLARHEEEVLSAMKHLTIKCRMHTEEKEIDDIIRASTSIKSLRLELSSMVPSPPLDAPNPTDSLGLLSVSTESLFIDIKLFKLLEEVEVYRVYDTKLSAALQLLKSKNSSLRSLHVVISLYIPTDLGDPVSEDAAYFSGCRLMCAENELKFECTVK